MTDGEFTVFFLIVTFFTILGGLALWKIFDMVRNSIRKKKGTYDEESFDRMAQAFIQFRKDTNRRLENIETVIASEESGEPMLKKKNYKTLEIEDEAEKSMNKSKTANEQRIS